MTESKVTADRRIYRALKHDDWYDQAVCKGKLIKPIDCWFTEEGSAGGITPGQRKALILCFKCPVREKCLEHALNKPERTGIWGGTTETQRKRSISLLHPRKGPPSISPEKALADLMKSSETLAVKRAMTYRKDVVA